MNLFIKKGLLPLSKKFIHTSKGCGRRCPHWWELATGEDRWQAVQCAKGNLDPYLQKPVPRGPGTKECPNIVPSYASFRVVYCICDDGVAHNTFIVEEGVPRRCDCNYWFVLERREIPPLYEDTE
ncbi:cytochrome c oxidase polypeptide Vb isoform 2, putative [Pediculus humanus corporis]|uniref:Cytochrome c oxidase polypeptide Vb isoform 2, putative n=1 Tax=Pediculus humanus subsp. corporis TaxID=121224 RepID=E0W2D1_PEDHC|nr:cytochrome c oxidase polypeptide Vb isoform 2, putative [Pediculus humanus corporis]EEB19787.1 cytochrome c oxidase polypeptide Vb isoform 2, putative [Pediculus humanus corporis]